MGEGSDNTERLRRAVERELKFGQVREDTWSEALEETDSEEETQSVYIERRVVELQEAKSEQRKERRTKRSRRSYHDKNSPFQNIGVSKRHVIGLIVMVSGALVGLFLFFNR